MQTAPETRINRKTLAQETARQILTFIDGRLGSISTNTDHDQALEDLLDDAQLFRTVNLKESPGQYVIVQHDIRTLAKAIKNIYEASLISSDQLWSQGSAALRPEYLKKIGYGSNIETSSDRNMPDLETSYEKGETPSMLPHSGNEEGNHEQTPTLCNSPSAEQRASDSAESLSGSEYQDSDEENHNVKRMKLSSAKGKTTKTAKSSTGKISKVSLVHSTQISPSDQANSDINQSDAQSDANFLVENTKMIHQPSDHTVEDRSKDPEELSIAAGNPLTITIPHRETSVCSDLPGKRKGWDNSTNIGFDDNGQERHEKRQRLHSLVLDNAEQICLEGASTICTTYPSHQEHVQEAGISDGVQTHIIDLSTDSLEEVTENTIASSAVVMRLDRLIEMYKSQVDADLQRERSTISIRPAPVAVKGMVVDYTVARCEMDSIEKDLFTYLTNLIMAISAHHSQKAKFVEQPNANLREIYDVVFGKGGDGQTINHTFGTFSTFQVLLGIIGGFLHVKVFRATIDWGSHLYGPEVRMLCNNLCQKAGLDSHNFEQQLAWAAANEETIYIDFIKQHAAQLTIELFNTLSAHIMLIDRPKTPMTLQNATVFKSSLQNLQDIIQKSLILKSKLDTSQWEHEYLWYGRGVQLDRWRMKELHNAQGTNHMVAFTFLSGFHRIGHVGQTPAADVKAKVILQKMQNSG